MATTSIYIDKTNKKIQCAEFIEGSTMKFVKNGKFQAIEFIEKDSTLSITGGKATATSLEEV